ncbi:MAG: hypothetical protein A3H96_03295 [Acidobacteria bacterium RIFCSPLOWO2_02_FULL_67_36]|nr:MAG: hypothetical protein A3H96_03295 [Acidobacteria bacterium RIFCSPLOWO2_02_FULL_67_36]OFW25205.1 MAG: hypothetical protein A3G21_08925 [Acidobacteria bacterium RIFCSPLOWO2_12_FULL_66_21]
MIVNNAKVYTAAGERTAEAVAIRGNQILRVGSNREINRLRRPQTEVIDAKGAAVLPGFNDAHVHVIDGGLALGQIDLSGADTIDEVSARIRAWADANPDQPWIVGRGLNAALATAPQSARQWLDELAGGRPAYLGSADGTVAWVNSQALRSAGITRRGPKNGAIVRAPRTDEPTGALGEGALALLATALPPQTRDRRARALRAAIAEAHQNGITSVHDVGAGLGDFELYNELRRAGDLQLRVYAALAVDGAPSDAELSRLDAVWSKYPDDPFFKTGALAIRIDGPVVSRHAALLEPYADTTVSAEPLVASDDLNRMVRLIDARGWQVMSDASGDRAVHMAIDAYEHAVRSNPAPSRGRRHRVEGVELAGASDLARLRPVGVIASMQPALASPEGPRLDVWTKYLGEERALSAWPFHRIAAGRGRLAFGSDWPSGALSPLEGIHTAVTRTTPAGVPEGGWNPAERLTLESAIDAYTSGAAYASFDEQRKGSLEAGMLADLVVLSQDIFTAPRSRLASTEVAVTIFDGKVVYRRNAKSSD